MNKDTWDIDKLIRTAQAYDRRAQREGKDEDSLFCDYRHLSYTARKWARAKQ